MSTPSTKSKPSTPPNPVYMAMGYSPRGGADRYNLRPRKALKPTFKAQPKPAEPRERSRSRSRSPSAQSESESGAEDRGVKITPLKSVVQLQRPQSPPLKPQTLPQSLPTYIPPSIVTSNRPKKRHRAENLECPTDLSKKPRVDPEDSKVAGWELLIAKL